MKKNTNSRSTKKDVNVMRRKFIPEFSLTKEEIIEIEKRIEAIGVVGDRYDAIQQSMVEY